MSQFWQKLFSKNTNARFWDYKHPDSVLWHVPKTWKCTFRKHECLKKGHAAPDPGAGCTP
jgi:hypothetical protein